MRIEVINTGTELVEGHILNTHLGYLSNALSPLGLRIEKQYTLPDGGIIEETLRESLLKADVVFLTGGLGGTSDDFTRPVLAKILNVEQEYHPEVWEKIENYFISRGRKSNPVIKSAASAPKGVTLIDNNVGLAPGIYVQIGKAHLFCLPGPPMELYPMVQEFVIPKLKDLNKAAAPVHQELFHIIGRGESDIQLLLEEEIRKIGEIEIAYCARPNETDLRLTAQEFGVLKKARDLVESKLAGFIYGYGNQTMEQIVVGLAKEKGKKIATVESCTGGLIAHRLSSVPGASEVFEMGWVTYSNRGKEKQVGVSPETLREKSAYSPETAREMSEGALKLSGADIAVSVTGIAGPAKEVEGKPAGTVFFGVSVCNKTGVKTDVYDRMLNPQRELFKMASSQVALDLVRRELLRD
jgi:nicotinamide-nucleotide amidase